MHGGQVHFFLADVQKLGEGRAEAPLYGMIRAFGQVADGDAAAALDQSLGADKLRLADFKGRVLPDELLRGGLCGGKSELIVEGEGLFAGRIDQNRVFRLRFCMYGQLRGGKRGLGYGVFLFKAAQIAADLQGNRYLAGVEHPGLRVGDGKGDLGDRVVIRAVHVKFHGKDFSRA